MSNLNVLSVAAFIATLIVSGGSQVAQAQPPFQLTVDANSIWIRAGESPVLQYRYSAVPFKPYVKELYTPDGINVLLDAPPDHLHHHGLMFAVAADGTNFWEETPTSGRQTHINFTDVAVMGLLDGPSVWPAEAARFAQDVYWVTPGGIVLIERRKVEACRANTLGTGARATALAWKSELRARRDEQAVRLTGSHYFGLGMRFPRSMDGAGRFLSADGKEGTIFRGEERLVRSNWCAYQATADGKPVTVAMFGHPDNPRSPTTWFTMAKPFAYMSATLCLHEEPLEVPARQSLMLWYCVAAWDRHVLPVQIDAFYHDWASRNRWKLSVTWGRGAKQETEQK